MYSPKISEELIPHLYWLAKRRRLPMTRVVNEALEQYLAAQPSVASHPLDAPLVRIETRSHPALAHTPEAA